uniref:Uncharacterized protein LOC109680923 n=1 Tax=Castor canadensis TaxID=51338 RepID=A0A8B7TU21_CASCN|nr:uncharacterized protein LOC109680923 [Castor canadensis]
MARGRRRGVRAASGPGPRLGRGARSPPPAAPRPAAPRSPRAPALTGSGSRPRPGSCLAAYGRPSAAGPGAGAKDAGSPGWPECSAVWGHPRAGDVTGSPRRGRSKTAHAQDGRGGARGAGGGKGWSSGAEQIRVRRTWSLRSRSLSSHWPRRRASLPALLARNSNRRAGSNPGTGLGFGQWADGSAFPRQARAPSGVPRPHLRVAPLGVGARQCPDHATPPNPRSAAAHGSVSELVSVLHSLPEGLGAQSPEAPDYSGGLRGASQESDDTYVRPVTARVGHCAPHQPQARALPGSSGNQVPDPGNSDRVNAGVRVGDKGQGALRAWLTSVGSWMCQGRNRDQWLRVAEGPHCSRVPKSPGLLQRMRVTPGEMECRQPLLANPGQVPEKRDQPLGARRAM